MDAGRILLIEDNEKDAAKVTSLLKERGYIVASASTGKEALDRLKNEKFDLIILDLMLPDMKGEDICSLVKRKKKLKDIPVIICSVKDEVEDIEDLFNRGADEYIIKPPRPSYLLSRIEAHIGTR